MSILRSLKLVCECAKVAFRIAPKMRICEWLSKFVNIPAETGAVEPGPLDTSRVPPMEGLYDLIANPKVHFFTLMKSARVGGTLFSIGLVLHKISENPGPILWMDPTRSSARALFRRELEPFLLQCKPVSALAIRDKEHWTASLCFFRGGSFLKLAGSGSPNELSGFQSELVIINEGDKISSSVKAEAPPHEQAAQRTKQFRFTRKIVENSTPTDEFGPTWRRFKRGSGRHCYLPCPHCSKLDDEKHEHWTPPTEIEEGRSALSYDPRLRGWQRITFFPEEVEVNFDSKLNPLPVGKVRVERTGKFVFDHCKIKERKEVFPGEWEFVDLGWDYDKVLTETQYQCSKGCRIDHSDLNWMLRRYRWIAHNPKAPKDHESAHYWSAYSPFEHWGETAKKFLLAIGDPGAMHDFYNSDLGLPFKAEATEVDESDIQKVVKASPAYTLRNLPFRPECLTITADVQGQTGKNPFWWMIWAWGIDWNQPGFPTIAALVDYGPAASWEVIEELAGIRPLTNRGQEDGDRWHEYSWKNPETNEIEKFRVLAGLVDSGDQTQSEANVYDFCLKNSDIFSPSKGGSRTHCGGNRIRLSPVYDGRLTLIWYWSDYYCQTLYRRIIKDRKIKRWLPTDLDSDFIDQLTDERTIQKSGRMVWEARRKNNHLGDCWKLQEVLSGQIEDSFDQKRLDRITEDEEAAKERPSDSELKDRVRALTTPK